MIKLSTDSPTVISQFKGKIATVANIQLHGQGKLFACLLGFYNAGDPESHVKELFFHLPTYVHSKTLPPREADFNIGEYDFCKVKMLTGTVYPEDEIFLSCLVPPESKKP